MKRHIYRVTSFKIVGPHTLRVEFDDRTSQTIDFRSVTEGQMFAPLKDLGFFNQVRLDAEVGTLVWPNGADFDPATLHDWPQYEVELTQRADHWASLDSGKESPMAFPKVAVVAETPAKYGSQPQ